MIISGNFRKIIVLGISVIAISTLLVLLSGGCYKDQRKDSLTQEEREWLSAHDGKIVLAHDPSANPIDFIDENGQFRGLAADYVELIEKRLNFKFNILHLKTWDEVIKRAKNGEIDVLCALTKSPQREKWLLFTDPYIEIPTVILTRKDIKETLTLDKMKNMKVTFTKGWIIDDFLRNNYSYLDMVPAVDEKTAMNYVSMGQADAWITALTAASIQIEEHRITNLRVAGETELSFKLAMASRKDWPILNHILKKGLTLISKEERSAIFNKWIHIEIENQISRKVWLSFIIIIGIALLIIFSILTWNRTLRRQVEHRTIELRRELDERKQAEKALQESEKRYRTFFEQDSDGIVVLDPETAKPIEFNDQVCRQLGYSREEFALLRVSDIEAKETAQETQAHIQKIFSEGYDDFETLQRTKQGEIRHVHVTAQVIEIAGRPVYHCIWRDITDRKEAEEQVKASLKEKEVLLQEIHHRVKNNMQVIISLLNLQADKIEDKKYADMLKESQNCILSMSLAHEQLYQSKDFANIDFAEYVKSFVEGLFGSYGVDTNKISLNIDIKDVSFDLENAIPCGLIINELISNSLKYAFPQGREGKISIALRPFNEDELELTVSDDGVGIPEDLDIEQTDTMGLHLVKVLAGHQLDGKIDLDRTGGTQFNIKFKRTARKPRI